MATPLGFMRQRPIRTATPDKDLRLIRIKTDLIKAGIARYNLWLPETKYLVNLLDNDETVLAAVYGHHPYGRGALFLTQKRVLFIDKKPMFLHFDDINFFVINSVTFTKSWHYGVVTVHSRSGDFIIHTLNEVAALNFVDTLDSILEINQMSRNSDYQHA